MTRITTSSENQRLEEEVLRNRWRLRVWRERFIRLHHREPTMSELPDIAVATSVRAVCPAGNANVVKMERRRKQYIRAHLPTVPDTNLDPEPPEAA